jgi:hypothetical protein
VTGVRLLDHWSPPDGAGAPVACLATTTFTLESDFFVQDCLSRFLSMSTAVGEGDTISSIAAVLEEDQLNEAQVSVLVDRSSRPRSATTAGSCCSSACPAASCMPGWRRCSGSARPVSPRFG